MSEQQPKETNSTNPSESVANTDDDAMKQITVIEQLEKDLKTALLAVEVEKAKYGNFENKLQIAELKLQKCEMQMRTDKQTADRIQRELEKKLSAANAELKNLKNRPKSKLDAELEQYRLLAEQKTADCIAAEALLQEEAAKAAKQHQANEDLRAQHAAEQEAARVKAEAEAKVAEEQQETKTLWTYAAIAGAAVVGIVIGVVASK